MHVDPRRQGHYDNVNGAFKGKASRAVVEPVAVLTREILQSKIVHTVDPWGAGHRKLPRSMFKVRWSVRNPK